MPQGFHVVHLIYCIEVIIPDAKLRRMMSVTFNPTTMANSVTFNPTNRENFCRNVTRFLSEVIQSFTTSAKEMSNKNNGVSEISER